MDWWAIIIASVSIAISVTSLTLGIRENYRHGVDWRFRPIAAADVPRYLDWRPAVTGRIEEAE
jgi:hypothetical protein